jgi:hypothetical protein
MTDKPNGKRWRWVTRAWIASGVLVLYLLHSGVPHLRMVQWHVIPRGPADSAAGVVYAPIFWVLDRSPPTVGSSMPSESWANGPNGAIFLFRLQ